MAAEAYSSAKKIKRLESKLVILKGSSISAPTSQQLEITRQEIVDLKTRLDAIQASIGEVVGEIGAQARAARGEALDDVATDSAATTEGVVTN
ncbi:hypothetical protein ACFX11_032977 [Malus domestica]